MFSLRAFVAFYAESSSRPVFEAPAAAAAKWESFKYGRSRRRRGEKRLMMSVNLELSKVCD